MCAGRNDLSQYINTSSTDDSDTSSNSKSAPIPQDRSSSIDASSVQGISLDELAADLLAYNVTDMCTESYSIGSGNIKQTIPVNRTCRCVIFDQLFAANTTLQQFAPFIRPLLYGKIYYYPSNIHYDNLIKELNQTFESLDQLIQFLREIEANMQPTYQTLSSLCNSISNATIICQQLHTLTTPMSLFVVLTEFIACTELNRFVAKSSESQLVQDGQNNSLTNTFLAGIVFLDDITGNSGLPQHVRYKIRMSLDYVDSTFQTQDK